MKISYQFEEEDMKKIQKELVNIANEEFRCYKSYWMNKPPKDMFAEAYEIAKFTAIHDYIMERIYSVNDPGSVRLMTLFQLMKQNLSASEITSVLYNQEMDYDRTMWAIWDDMDTVVENYLDEINK